MQSPAPIKLPAPIPTQYGIGAQYARIASVTVDLDTMQLRFGIDLLVEPDAAPVGGQSVLIPIGTETVDELQQVYIPQVIAALAQSIK